MMGYPSSTTNTNLKYGVWSWGTVELTFPNSYCLSYTLSNNYLNTNLLANGTVPTGAITDLQIGCVYNFVDTMYISWRYTDSNSVNHYGLDILDNSSSAAQFATWQSLLYDGGSRFKQKQAERLKISSVALPAGATLTPTWTLDRGTLKLGVASTATQTSALADINDRFYEASYGFNITTTLGTTTAPIVTGVTLEVDPMPQEVELMPEN
jgi:hypothetical protein